MDFFFLCKNFSENSLGHTVLFNIFEIRPFRSSRLENRSSQDIRYGNQNITDRGYGRFWV